MLVPRLLLVGIFEALAVAGTRLVAGNHEFGQQTHSKPQVVGGAAAGERHHPGEIGITTSTLEEEEGEGERRDHDHRPRYRFEYGVRDETTGDYKSHYEQRDGDYVQGHYELLEPDGRTLRSVHYSSGGSAGGFVATVVRTAIETQDAISESTPYSGEGETRLLADSINHTGKLTHVKNEMSNNNYNISDYDWGSRTAADEANGNGNGHYYEQRNYADGKTAYRDQSDVGGNEIYRNTIGSNGRGVKPIRKDETVYAESYGYGGREYRKPKTDDEEKIHHDERKQIEEYDEKYHGDLKSLNDQNYESGINQYGDGEESGELRDYDDDEDYLVKRPHHYDHDESNESSENGAEYTGHKYRGGTSSYLLTEKHPRYDHYENIMRPENSKATIHYNGENEFKDKRTHFARYENKESSEHGKATIHYSSDKGFREKVPHYDHYENDMILENGKATSHSDDIDEFRDKRTHYNHYKNDVRSENVKATSHYYSDGNDFRDYRPHYNHYKNDGSSQIGKATSHFSDDKELKGKNPHDGHDAYVGSSESEEELQGPNSHHNEMKQREHDDGNYHKSAKGQNYNGNEIREKRTRSSELRGANNRHHYDDAVKPVKEEIDEPEFEIKSGTPNNLEQPEGWAGGSQRQRDSQESRARKTLWVREKLFEQLWENSLQ